MLINPRFPEPQAKELLSWVGKVSEQFQSHFFLLSSGTTAKSTRDLKWVALSKEAVLASAEAVNCRLFSNSNDVWLHPLPNFHVGGLGIWARSFLSGARVVKLPENEKWNVDHFVSCLLNEGITLTSLVPTQVYDLVQRRICSPPRLRAVLVGGGALSCELEGQARALGWPVVPTYGMTEASSGIAMAELGCSSLKVLSHFRVEVAEGGRLKIKGCSLLSATIFCDQGKVCCVDPKENGWFLTQDRAVIQDGFISILGRIGDFVKIGGESVELSRLRDIFEQVLLSLRSEFVSGGSATADVALMAVPDERLGHTIHLVGDCRLSSIEASLLVDHFNAKVLGFERIRNWHCLRNLRDGLPRTSLGKLMDPECLKLIHAQMGDGVSDGL